MDNLIKFKKPLIVLAVLLVVAELVWAGYTLTRPVIKTTPEEIQLNSKEEKPISDKSATLVLNGPTSVNTNETFKVEVELTTDAFTIGTDLILKYDPKVLEIVALDKTASTVGKIYKDYPANSFDANGTIAVSGVSTDKGFIGKGIFASLNFKAKSKGATKITIDFKPNVTIDSNVTESSTGSDILKSVNSLDLTIN